MGHFLTREQIEQIAADHGTPSLVLDCNVLRKQHELLAQALPNVDFFYAVKAFPNESIIRTLDQCGAGFDIASTGETELLRANFINPRKTIHTHPIKKDRDIRDDGEQLRPGARFPDKREPIPLPLSPRG